MAITQYMMIVANGQEALNAMVADAIANGLQPYGNHQIDASRGLFSQAMTVGSGSAGSVTSADITDATDVGRSVLTAKDAATGLKALGGISSVASGDITDATAVGKSLITAANAAAALSDIGALAATGTAVSATKLATARKLSYTGGATGNANFDGTADVSIGLTLAAASANAVGAVKLGAAVANATDSSDTPTQLNALLASLRAAGVIASS